MEFAKILKELRKEKNYSAKELSEKLSCSINIIYDWEHGRCEPSYTVLSKLSSVFNVSTDYLLGLEDDFGNVTVSPGQLTDQLSVQEKELLDAFNLLGPFERDGILVQVKALAKNSRKDLVK